MNAATLNDQLSAAAQAIRDALEELDTQAKEYAKAERAYRLAKATAYLSTTGTVAEREARAEAAVNELRYQRDLADGLKVSALEAVRSHRGILSAVQTLSRLYTEELGLIGTGATEQPQWGAPEGTRGTVERVS